MFGHLPELLIILVVGLIVFGPEKLPEVAANAGKMMRDVRQTFDTAMNPPDASEVEPDDFTQYYYESLARSGETMPETPQDDEESAHIWQDAGVAEEGEPDEDEATISETAAETDVVQGTSVPSPATESQSRPL